MRHLHFTWEGYRDNFSLLITNGPAFQFDMYDISHIRVEITKLIDNLSKLYVPLLKQEEDGVEDKEDSNLCDFRYSVVESNMNKIRKVVKIKIEN